MIMRAMSRRLSNTRRRKIVSQSFLVNEIMMVLLSLTYENIQELQAYYAVAPERNTPF